jgi:hypothetical protein
LAARLRRLVETTASVPPQPERRPCLRGGGHRWVGHGTRERRLHESAGRRTIQQRRRRCASCRRAETVFNPSVVPRFLYSREVITDALKRRREGVTWEATATAVTADGELDASVVKHWHRQFQLDGEVLARADPPVALLRLPVAAPILGEPAADRSPDLPQEDPWARSPPSQP